MKIGFFKIFAVVSAVGNWAGKAFADGRVDAAEAAELVAGIVGALGLPAELKLPDDFQGGDL